MDSKSIHTTTDENRNERLCTEKNFDSRSSIGHDNTITTTTTTTTTTNNTGIDDKSRLYTENIKQHGYPDVHSTNSEAIGNIMFMNENATCFNNTYNNQSTEYLLKKNTDVRPSSNSSFALANRCFDDDIQIKINLNENMERFSQNRSNSIIHSNNTKELDTNKLLSSRNYTSAIDKTSKQINTQASSHNNLNETCNDNNNHIFTNETFKANDEKEKPIKVTSFHMYKTKTCSAENFVTPNVNTSLNLKVSSASDDKRIYDVGDTLCKSNTDANHKSSNCLSDSDIKYDRDYSYKKNHVNVFLKQEEALNESKDSIISSTAVNKTYTYTNVPNYGTQPQSTSYLNNSNNKMLKNCPKSKWTAFSQAQAVAESSITVPFEPQTTNNRQIISPKERRNNWTRQHLDQSSNFNPTIHPIQSSSNSWTSYNLNNKDGISGPIDSSFSRNSSIKNPLIMENDQNKSEVIAEKLNESTSGRLYAPTQDSERLANKQKNDILDSTLYTNKKSEMNRLHMEPPNFNKIKSLQLPKQHHSTYSSHGIPITNKEAVTPQQFAEMRQKYNYISDLRLKNPTIETSDNKVETTNSKLYVRAPNFSTQNFQKPDRPPFPDSYYTNNNKIITNNDNNNNNNNNLTKRLDPPRPKEITSQFLQLGNDVEFSVVQQKAHKLNYATNIKADNFDLAEISIPVNNEESWTKSKNLHLKQPTNNIQYAADSYSNKPQQRAQISSNMKQSIMPYDSLGPPMSYNSNHPYSKYSLNGNTVPYKTDSRVFAEPDHPNLNENKMINQIPSPMDRYNKSSSINYRSNVINSTDNVMQGSAVTPNSGLVDLKQPKQQTSRRLISPVSSSNNPSPIYRNYHQPVPSHLPEIPHSLTPKPRQIPSSSNFSPSPTYYPLDEQIVGNSTSLNVDTRLNKPDGSYYKVNNRPSQEIMLHKQYSPAISKRDNEYQKEPNQILQKSISPSHNKVTIKPNYREMISHACAVRNATSENDLNLQIIKRTLNCDIPAIRKSENDLSKNIFDSPEPNKFPSKILSTSSSEADLTRYCDKKFYENSNSYSDIAPSRSKSIMPIVRNSVNEIAVSIQPMNKCDSVYHQNNNKALSSSSSSVNNNMTTLKQQSMQRKTINNNIEQTTTKPHLSYDNDTLIPMHNPTITATTITATAKKANNFSPLDLSVKTVKTIADSTGCGEINQNYYNKPTFTNPTSTAVPKVDFTPNFLKHTANTLNEYNDIRNRHHNLNKNINPIAISTSDINKMRYALPESSSSSVIKTNSHGKSSQYRNDPVSSASSSNRNTQPGQYYPSFGPPTLIRKETFQGQKFESNVISSNIPSNTLAPFCPSSSTNYISSGKSPHSPNIPNRYLNSSPQLPTPTKYSINSTNAFNPKWLNDTMQEILPPTPPLLVDSHLKIQSQTNHYSSKTFKHPHLKNNFQSNHNSKINNQSINFEKSEQKINYPDPGLNPLKKKHWKVLNQSETSYQPPEKIPRITDNIDYVVTQSSNQTPLLKIQCNPQYSDVIQHQSNDDKFPNLRNVKYNQSPICHNIGIEKHQQDLIPKTQQVQQTKQTQQTAEIINTPKSNNSIKISNLNSDLKMSTVISHAPIIKQQQTSTPEVHAENQYRGANKTVISKLRTSIEMKEHAKQQSNIQNSNVSNNPPNKQPETQKTDISSILAARIRTKGELKGFVSVENLEKPTILLNLNENKSSKLQNVINNDVTVPTTLNNNPSEILSQTMEESTEKSFDEDQISDTDKSKSSFDLMDWGSACNDFVDQLLGNNKKRGKKRNNLKIPNSNPEDMPAVGKDDFDDFPGFACNLDIDIKLIEKIKKETEDLSSNRRIYSDDKDKVSSSSEENKPLLLLRQKSILSEDIPSMSDPVLKFSSPGQSASNHATYQRHKFTFNKSFDVASEKVAKSLRERYRLEQEKRFAARLSRSSSSESDNELSKRNLQRSRKQNRKRRMSAKQIIETDSSGIEDISMVRNLERSREEYNRRQKQEIKVTIKPDPDAPIDPNENSLNTYDQENESNSFDSSCAIIKKERIDNCIELKEDSLSMSNDLDEKALAIVKKENLDLLESKKLKTPSKTISSLASKNEETMTRSKRKRELEMQIANAKVLRNEKIVRNVNFNKKKSNYKSDDGGSQTKSKYRNQDIGKRKGIENENYDVCSKKQRSNNPSSQRGGEGGGRPSQHSSNDSNKESDNEKVKTRLRSRRLQESNESNAPGQANNKDRKSHNCKLSGKNLKKKETTPSKTSKIISNNSETEKYPPGWELEVYQYKRSLKIPASLITIKGSTKHRVSTSLPDLDPHTSDASENYSIDRKKSQKGGQSNNFNSSKHIDSFVPDEPKSIIDVLHSRVLKTKRLNKKAIRNTSNESKIIYNSSKDAELLATPSKDDGKLSVTGHHNVFEPQILNTRTRTESKNLKHKEIIREVFGGDDRPASAPPDIRDIDLNIKTEKMTFAEKYEQYLETMNIDFGQKRIRKNRNNQEVNQNTNSLEEHPTSFYDFKNFERTVKEEPADVNDDETLDTDIASSQIDDLKDMDIVDGQDTPSINSERDSMVTPVLFQQRKKTGRSRYSRKKGSSGFDYIRKKKKPSTNNTGNIRGVHWMKKITPELYDLQHQSKDENDVSREIQKWVLNKSVGQSALHKAARLGYIDVIAYCLEKMNLNPDPKDNAGYTPLHEACAKGRLDIARILLQYGANHSETAHSGIRPLHEASENGYIEIVRLLLSFGADPLLTTYSGQTPLALAENHEMEQFIKNYLFDVQNTGPHKQPWRFPGPWKIEDPDSCGYDVLYGAPESTQISESRMLSKFLEETPTSSTTPKTIDNKMNLTINKNKDDDDMEDSNIITNECQVMLDNIDHFDSVKLYKDYHRNKSKDQKDPEFISASSDGDGAIYEFEESEAPLPPLYVFKDEGKIKWLLLSDLCNLLKVKSKDTLLKQISACTPGSLPMDKDIFRELKLTEFLERATCLQLLCAGEKLNICSSKVMLVKYNESVRNLLGVETVLMQF